MAAVYKSCQAPVQYPDGHVDTVGQDESNATELPSEEERGGKENQREQEQHTIVPEGRRRRRVKGERAPTCHLRCSPIHLSLTHGCKVEALGDAVDGEQQDVAAVPAQEGGPHPHRQQPAPVEMEGQVRVGVAKGENG